MKQQLDQVTSMKPKESTGDKIKRENLLRMPMSNRE